VVFIGAVELIEEVVDRTRAGRSWRAAWFEFDRRGREPCPGEDFRFSGQLSSSGLLRMFHCFSVGTKGWGRWARGTAAAIIWGPV
jgi:hypothetical protein